MTVPLCGPPALKLLKSSQVFTALLWFITVIYSLPLDCLKKKKKEYTKHPYISLPVVFCNSWGHFASKFCKELEVSRIKKMCCVSQKSEAIIPESLQFLW